MSAGPGYNAIAGDVSGESDDGPALVFIHGLTFDRRTWVPAIEALRYRQPTRRILALDLPGHGESAAWPTYPMDKLVEAIHDSVVAAGLDAPVIVGHSLGAVVASVYATRHPTRGVVNVDQPLDVAPFMRMLQSLRAPLEGPGFPMVWSRIAESFHLERLSLADRRKIEQEGDPRQELVLGYWREALDTSPEIMAERVVEGIGHGRAQGRPYTVVAGELPEPTYSDWLARVFPEATIVVLAGSGHFPHIAHPEPFAAVLATTSTWTNRPLPAKVA